ncbi:MAG: hypothetical protein FWH18_06705 [Marinilabiliaceae bacterium]|nr:hypothetical protein [Marinilabiliaceae bacterium]
MIIFSLLAVMFPALTGFAFIYHHCLNCDIEKKDAVLVLLSHNHNENDSFCNESDDNHSSCCYSHLFDTEHKQCQAHQHDSEPHNHLCEIDLKKLEYSSTECNHKKLLPFSVELKIFVGILPQFLSFTSNYTELHRKYLFPPPFFDTEINILNCIFRL